jgi:uncharacterized protein
VIFVDSSAWVAMSDARDGNHLAALEEHRQLVSGRAGRLVTTDYILDEAFTLVRKYTGPDGVRRFAAGLEGSKSVQVVWVTAYHFRLARELFLQQTTTRWSFTDCTSFVMMRELGIRKSFAFDPDFLTAGFETEPGR